MKTDMTYHLRVTREFRERLRRAATFKGVTSSAILKLGADKILADIEVEMEKAEVKRSQRGRGRPPVLRQEISPAPVTGLRNAFGPPPSVAATAPTQDAEVERLAIYLFHARDMKDLAAREETVARMLHDTCDNRDALTKMVQAVEERVVALRANNPQWPKGAFR